MSFAAAINCIDGRTQVVVIDFVRRRCRVPYVDLITEPSPVRVLARRANRTALKSIARRIDFSIQVHQIESLAVVAHHDCRANPEPDVRQQEQLTQAVAYLGRCYAALEIIGVWVNFSWGATEWCCRSREGQLTKYG
jgi:hypothetical protein